MANEARHIQPVGTKRGAYSKLNPQFAEIVDYFCSFEEDVARIIRFLNSQFSIKRNAVSLLPSKERTYVF